MASRQLRQGAIRRIVRERAVRTQRDLAALLQAEGFACTQATVSRDIADMGVTKIPGGGYALAEDLHLQRMVRELVESVKRSDNLVLVKASAGAAPGVAAALDAAALEGILGSVAGDDTILVIMESAPDGEAFVHTLERLRQTA
jgi:transcriptional regulator of arginine metabolism